MDGTIANLYSITNWLERLREEDTNIFKECKPLITQNDLFNLFPSDTYEIVILSMTPYKCSKLYHNNVIQQKNEWLDKFFPNIVKRYYLPYGSNKNYKNSKNCILVDDNETIRNNYKGLALFPMWL